ncbi:hypothetical protein PHYBLDRAFT_165755 [Phycomyces blakesleeanus NRRL 1555(-)]|uniref:Uncharacterized protein n=1 Tax=Phycomyces blakesleeanus (strain ATCC 8743b / DSM 1359 / FGSC 10004 / NBRC 33097 / NRRL 1555) TaxID=763407 RepID=A0A167NFC1_PHYB8|nr:hypothetical protein PHYBLDRAFT_165755 [Phycomyces blakesleeanus NRRL 1555(-)]OAD75769.1 hypothetical protein PHYBLDRAFT_165755 [Phycomyces blakesleeanus NRRL 1555(-)]|eukprot:XP_018293809.1 hypothetical protein PHYBLDRAFT_165755 [Phycomyces blakesleeanus NRRL 1555(-)]
MFLFWKSEIAKYKCCCYHQYYTPKMVSSRVECTDFKHIVPFLKKNTSKIGRLMLFDKEFFIEKESRFIRGNAKNAWTEKVKWLKREKHLDTRSIFHLRKFKSM